MPLADLQGQRAQQPIALMDLLSQIDPQKAETIRGGQGLARFLTDMGLMFAPGMPGIGETGKPVGKMKTLKDVYLLAKQIEPAPNALISIRELRQASGLSKMAFDKAILKMVDKERVFLHRHVYPGGLNAAEKEMMVKKGNDYYMGLVLR